MTKLLKSSAIRAFVFKMEKAGTPVSVTIDDLQAVKDYEAQFGKVEIAGVLIDREIELKIAIIFHSLKVVYCYANRCACFFHFEHKGSNS